jgi:hypothetical protein
VDLQVTRGFRWGISMSRSGESYVSVVTGAELRGRTSERPPEAAPERLGAHRARCGSRRSIRAVLRSGHDGNGRLIARCSASERLWSAGPTASPAKRSSLCFAFYDPITEVSCRLVRTTQVPQQTARSPVTLSSVNWKLALIPNPNPYPPTSIQRR